MPGPRMWSTVEVGNGARRVDPPRHGARERRWQRPTIGVADGWVQANLVVLPRQFAEDFRRFCERNPGPCPLLDVTEAGSPEPTHVAPGADLRVDVPRYRSYRHGAFETEIADLTELWRPDHVGFLLGCSFTFEAALQRAGIPL